MSRDNLRSMAHPNVAGGALPGLKELGLRATPIAQAWAEDDASGALDGELRRWRSLHRDR